MIKFVYFDYGSVLVNYDNVFHKVCADFNLDYDDFMKFYDCFDQDINLGKITTEQYWVKCVQNFNLKNANNYDLPKHWVSDYKIIQPVSDLIYSLEGKLDIGIISNINSGIWEAGLKYGYVPNIKYKQVLLSYKLKLCKPNPKIYALAQELSGVKPQEILFVDDKQKKHRPSPEYGLEYLSFRPASCQRGSRKYS
jgi:putative hydrolase of the HAD superfamily